MSEQLKESMSAVMDGEADAFELRRVLDEATGNEDLREQWHRMHLMRDVLRGELASTDDARTLRERVQIELAAPFDDAVQAEPLHEVAGGGGASSRPNWLGRMTGTAVAAGVAMLIVFSADFGGAPDAPELAEADPFMNTEITEVDDDDLVLEDEDTAVKRVKRP